MEMVKGNLKVGPFIGGAIAIPSVVVVGTKVLAIPGLVNERGVSELYTRPAAALVTGVAHFATGRTSFTWGALLGQIPGLVESVGGAVAEKVAEKVRESRQALPPPAQTGELLGIGQYPNGDLIEHREMREQIRRGRGFSGVSGFSRRSGVVYNT